MMELDQFIKETLVEIQEGIRSANEDVDPKKPTYMLRPGSQEEYGAGIQFDVAVTVKSEKGAKAGGKVRIAMFEADASGGGAKHQESVSRIKFTVGVVNKNPRKPPRAYAASSKFVNNW